MIVGVTDEGKGLVEKYISANDVKYPIALDSAAGKIYGASSIPSSVLVGPDGKVLWSGHPGNLNDATIEKSLENATFIPPLPASLARFNALLKAKKFGKAYLDLKKAVQDKKAPEADAGPTIAGIEAKMKALLSEGEKAKSAGDFYTVGKSLSQLKTLYAGTDEAKKAADILKEAEKDQKARDQMKAADTIAKLERAMEAKAFVDAYKGYKGLVKKFPGTTIEKIASEQVAMIEKEKLLSYRSNCNDCKKRGKTCPTHRA